MARTSAAEVSNRRSEILKYLEEKVFVGVADLSAAFGVSDVTIRRDLDALESTGRLARRHGGAVALGKPSPETHEWEAGAGGEESLYQAEAERSTTIDEERGRIAERATKFLDVGEVVLLSGGMISAEIARRLLQWSDLTVITNATEVFDILRDNRHIHLVSTGGELRYPQRTLVGPLAESSIQDIRADKLFLEPSGISLHHQLYSSSLADVSVQQAMIHAAREVFVLADHEAFDRQGIMQVASLSVASKLISAGSMDEARLEDLRREGIEVVTV
jgi:DeoR/GlpR family transcriptional regulator of sugar metabolism